MDHTDLHSVNPVSGNDLPSTPRASPDALRQFQSTLKTIQPTGHDLVLS